MDHDDLRGSLERLVRLGRTPNVDIRPVLLRVLVDMFVRRLHHAPGDLAQFEDMIGRLLDDADAEVRSAVADKLAGHPATPRSLVDRFLGGDDATAAPMLARAAVGGGAMLHAAGWGRPALALAVASRPDLSPDVVSSLVERPEREVLLAVAENMAAPVGIDVFRYLVRRARDDAALGSALLKRDAPASERAPLFLFADSADRAAIILAARRDDLGPDMGRTRLTPEETAALERIERAVMAPDRDGFDTALATALNIRLDDVWRLIDDPKGEPLALALAAVGASPELAARVFILSGPAIGHSVMAVRTLTALVEGMPRRTAARLVAAMTHAAARVARRPEAETRGRLEDGRSLARPRKRAEEVVADAQRRLRGV
ncbi:DUF2336 domain-containing protein [Lichenibacterium dinghuense]|uniref:DUF2336 domain-containing protein n=1 Tax=Lichenibacterium dinghuense TaxID=2895977 RepID=UPI001F3524E4|nr:DUF2336 domain-containing protein [Lichenibacterium sp. 6Y81]